MNHVRLKLTPTQRPSNSIHLLLEWVEMDEAEQIVDVLASEEFTVGAKRLGEIAYVSRAAFPEGELLPGTFWLDGEVLRHFFASAETGVVGLLGETAAMQQG